MGIALEFLIELGERAGEIIIKIIKIFNDPVAPVSSSLSSYRPVENGRASAAYFGSAAILLRYLRLPHPNKFNVAKDNTISFKNRSKATTRVMFCVGCEL